MGILRGVSKDTIEPLLEEVYSSGLETIEITMNTLDAADVIQKAVSVSAGRMMVGAGTVLNIESLKVALSAGATFIVMPTLVNDVAEYCFENNIPFFPGALSPQEILNAWNAGAAMVKVFPVKFFGPEYIKELKGPFNNIELLACGGVTPDNLNKYFNCGASAFAFGSSIFKKEQLDSLDFKEIAYSISEYVRIMHDIKNVKVEGIVVN